jgi:hypothetical protein
MTETMSRRLATTNNMKAGSSSCIRSSEISIMLADMPQAAAIEMRGSR